MPIFYLDYDLGSDSTTATPLGWWSVAYTGGSGTEPLADEVVTGASSGSTAKLTVVVAPTSGSWAGNNAAGTMYFYGKSAPFQSEQVDCAGGGHFHITSDFTFCAWKTTTSGAAGARIAPGDTIRIAKSPAPYSIGNATWTTTTTTGGGFPATKNIVSSTNASPIVVTLTSHGYVNGDVVQIIGHTTNTAANGAWIVANKTDNTFELEGSVGNGIGTAVGTAQLINSKTVQLATAQTTDVCRCEGAPNMVVNGTFTGSATGWTLNAGWAYGSNAVAHTNGGGTGTLEPSTPLTVVANASYYVIYTVSGYSSGSVTAAIGGANGTTRSSAATFSEVITTTGTGNLTFTPSNDFAGTIDTVEVYFGAWIAANSSTVAAVAVATDAKEGGYCTSVTKATYSTSTLYAYCPIPTIDLSGRYKLSFWIKNSAATLATHWVIKLCSDNAGVTAVDTFTLQALPSSTRWVPLTVARDGGGALGGTINSIAIYSGSVAPTAASTLYVDNFIACDTSGLNLQSLVSTNSAEQAGTEGWYPIQSINGKVVLIDNDTNTKSNAGRGWSGTTVTDAATYARETIKTTIVASAFTTVQEIQDSGSSDSSLITYSGGWNSSNNTREGESFFDGLAGTGYGIYASGKNYISLLGVCAVRYGYGIYFIQGALQGKGCVIDVSECCGSQYTGVLSNMVFNNVTIRNANNNLGTNISISGPSSTFVIGNSNNQSGSGYSILMANDYNLCTSITNSNNNGSAGLGVNGTQSRVLSITSLKYNLYGLYFSQSSLNKIYNAALAYNTTDFYYGAGAGNINYLYDCTTTSSGTEFTGSTAYPDESRLFSQRHDNTDDNHWIFSGTGTINAVADADRHTLSGIAWKLKPTNAARTSAFPLSLTIGKVACAGSGTVTVSAWVKKSHATNVGAKLRCKGKQIAGEDVDVYSAEKANDTNYEQLSLTLTPSAEGAVEIECLAWTNSGTSDSVFVDDFTVTQT